MRRRDTGRRRLWPWVVPLLLSACALPRWPVHGPMSSAFGLRFRGLRPEIHRGVDIHVPAGTPVRAMSDGVVAHAGPLGDYGLTVILRHTSRLVTLYGHLSRVDVSLGQHVSGQEIIGAVGQTGNATGPHLHFEILRWGHAVDPVPLLGGPPG